MRRRIRAPRRGLLLKAGLGVLALILAVQLVPLGRDHANPAVARDAPWPNNEARALARTACYDCHSNQTRWPLYSYVAPLSWLLTRDVERGREELNLSEWDGDGHDAAESVEDGSMPPGRYLLLHPDARLSAAERAVLADALEAMDERGGDSGRGPGQGRGRR